MNFKRYVEVSDTWVDSHYIKGIDTDTITTLPATIYPLAQSVTLSLKGNTVQSGTPTPSNPVPVVGVGELDNGQYKIPISSANTTTPIYLGEVETTRQVKKLVLDGTENWQVENNNVFTLSGMTPIQSYYTALNTHYIFKSSYADVNSNNGTFSVSSRLLIHDDSYATTTVFKQYLAAQYAAGTPVCVWYVLATEETGIVNEPLMKIGDYADSISSISIPTTVGSNSLDVDTTVKPSEVSAEFSGWHPVSAAHERSGGAWS